MKKKSTAAGGNTNNLFFELVEKYSLYSSFLEEGLGRILKAAPSAVFLVETKRFLEQGLAQKETRVKIEELIAKYE